MVFTILLSATLFQITQPKQKSIRLESEEFGARYCYFCNLKNRTGYCIKL